MRLSLRSVSRILSIIGTAGLIVAWVPGIASAAPHGGGNFTCNGTLASPGTLAGNYANVYVGASASSTRETSMYPATSWSVPARRWSRISGRMT